MVRLLWEVCDAPSVDELNFPNEDLLDELGVHDTPDRRMVHRVLSAMMHDFMLVIETLSIPRPLMRLQYQNARLLGMNLVLEPLTSQRVLP